LEEAIREAVCYDGRAIIEEFIDGYELTVGILDDKPLPVIRIKPSLEFYSYKAKYTQGLTEYLIPADVDNRIQTRAQELAIQAHKLLGCRCFSRVDMLYSLKDDEIYVLEVNTIPGLTKTSLLPKAAKAVGIDFDQLVKIMLNSALDKVKCLRR
jgi:D-alanine-D-alanine ligase